MTWRDRLRTASFRGVEFFVDEVEGEHGRKLARHDYVLRDIPWHEDLGRKARGFRVDGYVLGEEYDEQLERLVRACEQPGPGTLVHPRLGEMLVVCETVRTRESRREGRIAIFSATFLEAGELQFPTVGKDPLGAVGNAGTLLGAAASTGYDQAITNKNVPAFVQAAAAQEFERTKDVLEKLGLRGPTEVVRNLLDRATALADSYLERLANPSPLAAEVFDLIADVEAAAGSRLAALEAYLSLAHVRALVRGGTGPLARATQGNADATALIVRAAAVRGAALAAAGATFVTYDDALRARERILEELDSLELEADDATLQALARLRAELVDAVPPAGTDLPRLDRVAPPTEEPSLVLAYALYRDAGREHEIVERNRVRNPGFLAAGVELEVLGA